MIDLNLLREKPEVFQKGADAKGVKVDISLILELDKNVRDLRFKIEDLRMKQNQKSRLHQGSGGQAKINEAELNNLRELKGEIKGLEGELKEIEPELEKLLLQIPNPPLDDVKIGKDESDNEVLKTVGEKTEAKKDYLTLAKELDLIDTERAAKVSGSRFGYIKGKLAQLEFALVQYGLETLAAEGFVAVVPPVIISKKAMAAMGYLEHGGEDETYHLEKDDLYLVGTSEQSVGPMHMDEILDIENQPKKYVAFSTCFRREAGSYGKDTAGILRVHQFDKLEMFIFCKPEESKKMHEKILELEEKLMTGLKLPYQVVNICAGDLGAPAAKKYDIETWIPSENKYRETHSTSNCTDFQSRRLNIRYKNSEGKNEFAHMLNGTAFAIGRMLIAIIENYQREDGSIEIPEVLKKYTGFSEIK